jgi:hypothetical protein
MVKTTFRTSTLVYSSLSLIKILPLAITPETRFGIMGGLNIPMLNIKMAIIMPNLKINITFRNYVVFIKLLYFKEKVKV